MKQQGADHVYDVLVRPVGSQERRTTNWSRVIAAGATLAIACIVVAVKGKSFVQRRGGSLLEGGTWDEGLPNTPLPKDAIYQTQHAVAASLARLLQRVDSAYEAYGELEKAMQELRSKESHLQEALENMRRAREGEMEYNRHVQEDRDGWKSGDADWEMEREQQDQSWKSGDADWEMKREQQDQRRELEKRELERQLDKFQFQLKELERERDERGQGEGERGGREEDGEDSDESNSLQEDRVRQY